MKTRIFLGMGLLVSAIGFGQTYSEPSGMGVTNPAGTLGTNNVHLGHSAGFNASSTGGSNVFVGYRAGYNIDTGVQNILIGYEAGYNFQDSTSTITGYRAGRDAVGNGNSFYGFGSGKFSNGAGNVFSGNSAGYNVNGNSNVIIGNNAGAGEVDNPLTTGVDETLRLGTGNVLVGYASGQKATGGNNVFLGRLTGTIATGSKNIFIGYSAGSTVTAGDNLLFIENSTRTNPLIYGDFTTGTRQLKFNAKKVGIGFDSDETGTSSGNEGFGDFTTNLINDSIYRLYVRGGILAEEVRIRLQDDWADYVFAKDYKLLSLKDTEKYIAENGHLPNMPSAGQVKEEGLEFGNITKLQQEKIEELTLHLIEQQKQIEQLKAQVQLLLNK